MDFQKYTTIAKINEVHLATFKASNSAEKHEQHFVRVFDLMDELESTADYHNSLYLTALYFYYLRDAEFLAYKALIEILVEGMFKLYVLDAENVDELLPPELAVLRNAFKAQVLETLAKFGEHGDSRIVKCYRHYLVMYAFTIFVLKGYFPFRKSITEVITDAEDHRISFAELMEEIGVDVRWK